MRSYSLIYLMLMAVEGQVVVNCLGLINYKADYETDKKMKFHVLMMLFSTVSAITCVYDYN
jgi:hypothetical protein